jgi:hypothetical protein
MILVADFDSTPRAIEVLLISGAIERVVGDVGKGSTWMISLDRV